jgi:hypothetical protein
MNHRNLFGTELPIIQAWMAGVRAFAVQLVPQCPASGGDIDRCHRALTAPTPTTAI